MKLNPLLLLSLAMSSVVFAEEASTADAYAKLLKGCKPSCYKAEGKRPGNNKFVNVCGYQNYPYTAFRLEEGGVFKSEKWTPAKMRGVPGGSSIPTTDCTFPDDSGGKWSDLIDEVKADFKAVHPKTARYVVMPDQKYEFSTARNGQVNRDIYVRIYADNHRVLTGACGTSSPTDICEASGSKGARAANIVRYRLDEVKKLQADGKNELCRAAAYDLQVHAQGLEPFRARRKAATKWTDGNTYLTRYDGNLTEEQIFAKVASMAAEGAKLYATCGGKPVDAREADLVAAFGKD